MTHRSPLCDTEPAPYYGSKAQHDTAKKSFQGNVKKHFKMPFLNCYSFKEVFTGSFLFQYKSSVIIFSTSQINIKLIKLHQITAT